MKLEGYGAPPLSVVPSEQLRLHSTSFGYDPLEQEIAEKIGGAVGGGGGGSGDGGGEGGSGDDGGGDAGGGGASSAVGSSSPGFVGLALSYALSISWLLQGTLRTVMQAESP